MTSRLQSQPLAKTEQTKASLRATRERRKNQRCRVYELKIDKSHLAQETLVDLLNQVPFVWASTVAERGSLTASA